MSPGSASWAGQFYGSPCKQRMKRLRFAGRWISVNADAIRGFRRLRRVFKQTAGGYYKSLKHQPDIWTYNCRKIGGTSTWSNHAWALAIDIDSSRNYQGAKATSTDIWNRANKAIVKLENEKVFRWGGRFSNPDPMHFEIIMTPAELRKNYYKTGHRKFGK